MKEFWSVVREASEYLYLHPSATPQVIADAIKQPVQRVLDALDARRIMDVQVWKPAH